MHDRWETKSTVFRQHAFTDTFAGFKFPTVDSEARLCRKDKHWTNFVVLTRRSPTGIQGYVWRSGGERHVISDQRLSLSISSERAGVRARYPIERREDKLTRYMPASLLNWRSGSNLAFLGHARKS